MKGVREKMMKKATSVWIAAIMVCMVFSAAAFAAGSPTKGAKKAGTALTAVWWEGDAKTGKVTVHASGRGISRINVQYKKHVLKVVKDDFGHEYLVEDTAEEWKTISFNSLLGKLKLDKDGLYSIRVAAVGKDGRATSYRSAENLYVAKVDPVYEEGKESFNVKADPAEVQTGIQIMHAENDKMIGQDIVMVETSDKLDKTIEKVKSGKHYASVRPYIQLVSNENKKENEKYDVTKDLDKIVDTYFGISSDVEELDIK